MPELSYRVTLVVRSGDGPREVTSSTPVLALEMPNDATAKGHPWSDFKVSVDRVEADTGYDFLSALPDDVERHLEAAVAAEEASP